MWVMGRLEFFKVMSGPVMKVLEELNAVLFGALFSSCKNNPTVRKSQGLVQGISSFADTSCASRHELT